jgi:hypothetical protein
MILDENLLFGYKTALSTAAPATSKYGKALDLLNINLDRGEGWPFYFCAFVNVAATSGGAATLALALTHADNEDLTTNPVNLYLSPTFALADLTPAGKLLFMVALPKGVLYKRWLGVRQIVGAHALTAGALNVFLTPDPDNWRAYAEGAN